MKTDKFNRAHFPVGTLFTATGILGEEVTDTFPIVSQEYIDRLTNSTTETNDHLDSSEID